MQKKNWKKQLKKELINNGKDSFDLEIFLNRNKKFNKEK